MSIKDAARFRKTYSFFRQERREETNITRDVTRFHKAYSFTRQQPRLLNPDDNVVYGVIAGSDPVYSGSARAVVAYG